MKFLVLTAPICFALTTHHALCQEDSRQDNPAPTSDFLNLELEDLLHLRVTTPSKIEETLDTSPAIISVLTQSDIADFGGNSLFDILDRAVGVFMYGSYYLPNNMVTLRGEATSHYTTHVLMLINGRPFRNSKEGYLLPILSAFPIDAIKRIEIIRGPGSALYGSTAYVGVINIITKKKAETDSSGEIKVGSFGTKIASFSTALGIKELDFTFSAKALDEAGWDIETRDADDQGILQPAVQDKAEERAYGIHSTLNYKDISINAFYGSNYINNGYQLKNVYNWPELNLGTNSAMIDFDYARKINNSYSLSVNLTHNYQYYWQPFDDSANDDREIGVNRDILLELTQHYSPTTELSLTFGALANYYSGHIENNQMLSDGSPYNVWENPKNPAPFQVVPKYNDRAYSLYLNSIYQLGRNTKLIAGLHGNKLNASDSTSYSPRLGIIVKTNPKWSYKLLFSEAYRAPDNFELYSTIPAILGNEKLNAEKIRTLETEILYGNDNVLITASAFINRQKNLITRKNQPTTTQVVSQQFINQGKIHSWGIESSAKATLSAALSLQASASYHQISTVNGDKDPFGVPNLYLKLGVAYRSGAVNTGIFATHYNYMGDVYGYDVLYPKANARIQSFTYTTLNCDIDLNKFLPTIKRPTIIGNIYISNVFDESIPYAEYGRKMVNSTPGRPGIGIYAGIKIQY